jgi:hypothetical protein
MIALTSTMNASAAARHTSLYVAAGADWRCWWPVHTLTVLPNG